MIKNVWLFLPGNAEGDASMKDTLGGKGANLHEMCRIGLPVPPGFTISTRSCNEFLKIGELRKEVIDEINSALSKIEEFTGRKLGGKGESMPLLFSIRSGAKFSMPGMMDTVLNVGINDEVMEVLAKKTGNRRFALDCYKRFIEMYADVVCKFERSNFEKILNEIKGSRKYDTELDENDHEIIVERYKDLIKKNNIEIPQDPYEQILEAIKAVFRSWNNERAIIYRRIHNIPDDLGTACNIQMMVYGNLNNDSGTGVCFTRNPSNGEREIYGEFLTCAQGEDIVAGIRLPEPIGKMREIWPETYAELENYCNILEKHYKDMQDVEFTVENRKLYILQTRNGKRTVKAAVKIAHDMVEEGLIDIGTAILRIDPTLLNQLFIPVVRESKKKNNKPIAHGIPASFGAANGLAVFNSKEALELASKGVKVILIRPETSPEDIGGMAKSAGIVTAVGGVTSHAAVVARGLGKPCIVGCSDIVFENQDHVKIVTEEGPIELPKLTEITIDANDGSIYLGRLELDEAKPDASFYKLLLWASNIKKLKVLANADTPEDALRAIKFGAEGIGLCRTEHMFFEGNRIDILRLAIIEEDREEKKKFLEKLLPLQIEDFIRIFEIMNGLPVAIRLLDPPLHEFLPKTMEEIENFAKRVEIPVEKIRNSVIKYQEANPMLGLRGVRLGILYPEIYETQIKGIFRAAKIVANNGIKVNVEIMIPLVVSVAEVYYLKNMVEKIYNKELSHGRTERIGYKFGIMIETPRACLIARELGKLIDFASFGTNDLTQTVIGLSRDDAGKFLGTYLEKHIFKKDPFISIDKEGVGRLIEIAVQNLRAANKNIKIGVCGEHGGDPESIEFFQNCGLDYVSVSPYRIPTATIASAQTVLKE
ncbi:MAG: pyruvate, phosphate dikinase [Thermosulfidibacteraceae bacterium]